MFRNFEGGTVSDRAIGEQTTENNISSWSQKLSNLYVELEELQFSVKAKIKMYKQLTVIPQLV